MCPVPHAYSPVVVGQRYADPKSLLISHPVRKQQEDTYTHLWPLHARAQAGTTARVRVNSHSTHTSNVQ